MIKNEKEYTIAKAELQRFQFALEQFDVEEEIVSGVDPIIAAAQRGSFSQKIRELIAEINDFEALSSGVVSEHAIEGIEGFGKALIEARLSKGLSQKSLAIEAGLKEQQIQRYEKDLYQSANMKRLALIANTLGLSFDGQLTSIDRNGQRQNALQGFHLSDFPFSEMKKRGWFGQRVQTSYRLDDDSKHAALVKFFEQLPKSASTGLHRKTQSASTKARQAALLAWQGQVLSRAKILSPRFSRFSPLNSSQVSDLAKMSARRNGIVDAIQFLEDHGIIVIFEKHLPKTKIDGAALSLDGRHAVIALTLRFDRIDNFWFVLLHELGHLMRHWQSVLQTGIVDENAGIENVDLIEREADEFAENAILPAALWANSMVRFTKDPSQILAFAKRHEIHPALVAGRIRRDRGYREFADLIGEGQVRKILGTAGYWKDET